MLPRMGSRLRMKYFRQTLFPLQSRLLPGHRWINITLRSLHLIGIAGLGAGYLYPVAGDSWVGYLCLALISGVILILLSIWSNGIWLLQLRGQAILFKLLLLVAAGVWPEVKAELFVIVIIISSVVSHAPGDFRYYSLWHRRRLEQL